MYRLKPRQRKWLRAVHLFTVSAWVGAAIGITLLSWIKLDAGAGGALHGYNDAIKLIDDLVIIPAAVLTLLTGLVFSLTTPWGFLKHYWVTFSWVVTVVAIVFGTFWLGPWVNGMESLAEELGGAALRTADYADKLDRTNLFGTIQAVVLVATIFVSVLKPWGRRGAADEPESPPR